LFFLDSVVFGLGVNPSRTRELDCADRNGVTCAWVEGAIAWFSWAFLWRVAIEVTLLLDVPAEVGRDLIFLGAFGGRNATVITLSNIRRLVLIALFIAVPFSVAVGIESLDQLS
jgi:hypothetical protein